MSIESRLARLERSNRSLRALTVAALACVVIPLVVGMGAQPADTTRLQRLEIVDDAGRPLLVLSSEGGGGIISINHPSGAGLRLGAGERAGEITLFNRDQNTSINLSTGPDGRGTIETFDAAGHRLVGLTSDDEGGPLLIRNTRGDVLVSLAASENAGRIRTMSPGGTDLVTIGSTQSGAGLILAFDPAGRRMATIGSVGESGVVLTTAPDGTTTGVLGRAR